MQLVVYYFVFRLVLALDIPNYAAFAFSGMLVWTWSQSSLSQGAGAITNNRDLVRRPGFPIAILPFVTVTTNLVNLLLSLPILVIFLWMGGLWFQLPIVVFPVLIGIQFLLTLSLTYLVAALNVTFRDTQHIIGILLNILFYITPIFYAMSSIPKQYQFLFYLNPMTHLVEAYRDILLTGSFPNYQSLLIIILASIALLVIGYQTFQKASNSFAEEL
jgi:lipopolysaccharide transport system permease protein